MVSKLEQITLGEIVESVSIRHPFDKEKVIFLNTSDIFDGKILHSNYSNVENLPGQAKKSIKKNDILLSEIRPRNKRFALVDFEADDYVVTTKLMVLRLKENMKQFVSIKFLYYYLTSEKVINYFQMLAETRSGTFPQITFNEIKDTEIPLPSLNEQKLITSLLDLLSNRIDLNEKINQTLEEIAQAIFKHWFVDFEFPNENEEPYKSSGGKLVESELGLIPEGWDITHLDRLCKIKYGKNLPTKELRDSGYPVYGGNGIIGYYNEYLYEEPQVIVSCRGAASGKVMNTIPYSFITNNSLVLEIDNDDINYEYLKYYCLNSPFYDYTTGSAQPQLTINNIKKVKFLLPESKVLEKYQEIVNIIERLIYEKNKESVQLSELRDSLLPKLMSGEIRIPEAEQEVEACLQKIN